MTTQVVTLTKIPSKKMRRTKIDHKTAKEFSLKIRQKLHRSLFYKMMTPGLYGHFSGWFYLVDILWSAVFVHERGYWHRNSKFVTNAVSGILSLNGQDFTKFKSTSHFAAKTQNQVVEKMCFSFHLNFILTWILQIQQTAVSEQKT